MVVLGGWWFLMSKVPLYNRPLLARQLPVHTGVHRCASHAVTAGTRGDVRTLNLAASLINLMSSLYSGAGQDSEARADAGVVAVVSRDVLLSFATVTP